MRTWFKYSCTSLALAVVWTLLSPLMSEAAISHKSPQMIDVDTPHYIGYDSTLKAYHFTVTGRWRAVCGGKFCWGSSPTAFDIGKNDAVTIKFSDTVVYKKLRIRAYDACGNKTYDNMRNEDAGDLEAAHAGLNDAGYTSWRKTTNWQTGKVLEDHGTCKLSTLPTSGYAAGSYTYKGWTNLKAQHFIMDAWIDPFPSTVNCYAHLMVKAGYTHTWSTSGVSWGVGYPWGFGIGLATGTAKFFAWQDEDGYRDPALVTGKVCHH